MLVQQVTIKVYPNNGTVYADVEATISSISNSGQVSIDFNQAMTIPANALDQISTEALNVYVTDYSGALLVSRNFTWKTLSYQKN